MNDGNQSQKIDQKKLREQFLEKELPRTIVNGDDDFLGFRQIFKLEQWFERAFSKRKVFHKRNFSMYVTLYVAL